MEETKDISQAMDHEAIKGPKALFWFLTLFFTLGTAAFAIGGLWFQFINKWFPLEISYGQVRATFNPTNLKMSMASLIIAGTMFYFVSHLIRKALKNGQLEVKNKVRLWITYIILFFALATAIGDLISILYRLLDGDYTASVLLKALVILIIVSAVFYYYWQELRSANALKDSSLPKKFGYVSLAVIIVSLVGSFFLIDSPSTAREKSFDQERAYHLSQIKYAIDNYYSEFKALPPSLAELQKGKAYITIVDPQNSQPYEYQIVNETSYQLCAEFTTSNKDQVTRGYSGDPYSEFLYDAGRNCFDHQVSQDFIDKPVVVPPVR